MKQNAFTLIEVIVVLVIVGVLAAIAIPTLFTWPERARAQEGYAVAESIKETLEPLFQKNGGSPPCSAGDTTTVPFVYNILNNIPTSAYFLIGNAAICDEPTCAQSVTCQSGILAISVDRSNYSLATDPCSVASPPSTCSVSICGITGSTHKTGIEMCRNPSGTYEMAGAGFYSGL